MEEEDTIELIDYLRVVWKWKWMIILVTLVCVITAGVISLKMPKVYEVSTIIEPGIVGLDKGGKFIYLDSRDNIGEKIKEGIYNNKIIKELNIDPLQISIGFKFEKLGQTQFIKVISEWEEKNIKMGLNVLRKLISLLPQDYKKVIEQKRSDYDKQILMKQNEIARIETQRKDVDQQILMKQNEIARIETQRKDVDQQILKQKSQIAKVETNRKDIDKQILKKKNQIIEIEIQRKDIDKQILFEMNKIEGKKDSIKLKEGTLNIIGEREKELLQEIKSAKNNTERLVQQRNTVLQHKSNAHDISLLLYSTTIQQNVAYFNRLSDQINELKKQKMKLATDADKLKIDIDDVNTVIERLKLQKTEGLQTKINDINAEIERLKLEKTEGLQAKIDDINAEIERLKLEKTEGLQAKIDDINAEIERLRLKKTEGLQVKIDDLKVQIDSLSLEKGIIKDISVIQNPEVSLSPIKPKKKLNVMLAFVIGLFISIFLAFFLEYLQKMRSVSDKI